MKVWRGLLIAGVVLLAGWAGYQAGRPSTTPVTTHAGASLQTLLTSTTTDLDGQPRRLKDIKGQWRVINLWAAWCPPCRAEMPAFSNIQRKFAEKGVQFIGIALDDAEPVRAFLQTTPVNYPILLAPTSLLTLSADLGNAAQGLPFTFILDSQDTIVATKLGQWQEAELASTLAGLLSKP